MKIKPGHIQRFAAFIQNTKNPNEESNTDHDTDKSQKDKQINTSTNEDETKDSDEDKNDPLQETKKYHTELDKKCKHLWTSSI